MRQLVNHETDIKQGTALLINKKELLTDNGIQGKISKIGIGFGTGRHTSIRVKNSPTRKCFHYHNHSVPTFPEEKESALSHHSVKKREPSSRSKS